MYTKEKSLIAVSALVAAAIVAFLSLSTRAPPGLVVEPQPTAEAQSGAVAEAPAVTASAHGKSKSDSSEPAADDQETNGPTFRVDAAGNLIVDERTRLKIEELLALNDPGKVYESMREKTQDLPPAAARKAEELVDRVTHYQSAQRQSYPPGKAPLTEEDALAELDGLHALREAHFGQEVAMAFYANEEKLSRELIELMRVEKDQGLSLPEKAERAQALHDSLPTVAAIEKKNRDIATRTSGE